MLESADLSGFDRCKMKLLLFESIWVERVALSKRMSIWRKTSISKLEVNCLGKMDDVHRKLMNSIEKYSCELEKNNEVRSSKL